MGFITGMIVGSMFASESSPSRKSGFIPPSNLFFITVIDHKDRGGWSKRYVPDQKRTFPVSRIKDLEETSVEGFIKINLFPNEYVIVKGTQEEFLGELNKVVNGLKK